MLKEYLNENRKYSLKEMIFIISSVIVISGVFGWVYEFIFYYFNGGMKEFYMQGGNYLPWINIYAYGALLILFFCYKHRNSPLKVFLISALATGLLELVSGYVLYDVLGLTRCWDYNKEILNFGNIGGFICLRSVTFFGLSGLLLIYSILPVLTKLIKKVNINILLTISIIICSIFLIDELYNLIFYRFLPFPRASSFYKSHGWKYVTFK